MKPPIKALITGSRGFVGRYLRDELEKNNYEVIGLDREADGQTIACDLMGREAVIEVIRSEKPDVVFHLAGQANVGLSWKIPGETVELNVVGSINILEAVRECCPSAKVILIGTSDQYGPLGANGELVSEETPTHPMTPYAISKQSVEQFGRLYGTAYHLHVCMTRSFNHGGAGQREGFVISDFSSGIAQIELGLKDQLRVGNLESRRDYTHVKDVVRAYRMIYENGRDGEIYNVGSGRVYSTQELLDRLCQMASCPIPIFADPTRMRRNDTPIICCDHSKLTAHTGWQPVETFDTILLDTLTYYRQVHREKKG